MSTLIGPRIYLRPRSPMAEAEDLKSSKCGFDPHRGHRRGLGALAFFYLLII